ncbi:MAG: nitrate reductase [Pseudomonadales bacterium]|jgi:periplasmic nitrate reductase NapE|nr:MULTISPECIES: hypothetical protein [unclassified Ketobacter]MAA58848.1 nitrate reductase [Pseudomonadales bacterium]MEC8809770.1 nitrate reductase [Pseudomonadota bacterium]TNC90662.1 MAG: nitrate reductase [Alcanivorax sp.]HAG95764.1 nitrate reductase [Gammaproteobacteria bacterium]MAQ25656.1 nitrate reductase [Pseudomonadales bacterium]|tara:strand:+ start:251 stop:397 length:147 start_codon:yes stop_codon:yes gene_type:complete
MNSPEPTQADKKQELLLFLFLTVVLAPAIAVAAIGGYGLFIWISQMLS